MADGNTHSRFPAEPTAKRAALLAAVASIRETVERHAEASEQKGTLAPAIVDALTSTGLFTLKLPEILGGAEADPRTQFDVIEALSAIDPSTGWCLMIGGTGAGLPGGFLHDEAIAEMFKDGRSPRCAIVAMPTGTAIPEKNGFRLTGRWSFVSGVPHAEWVTVGARIDRQGTTEPEFLMMTLPVANAKLHDNWHVMGLKGTGSCDVSVENQFVPETFTWNRMESAPHRGGALYRLGQPGFVAIEHAAFALGVGRGALDTVITYAKSKRRSFALSPSALESRAVFQRMVGLADMKLRGARAVVLEVYDEAWAFTSSGEVPPPRVQAAIRGVTSYATEVACDVTTECFRYGGGEAAFNQHRLQRYLRDVNVGAQHLMVSTIAYEHHGHALLGLPDLNPLR